MIFVKYLLNAKIFEYASYILDRFELGVILLGVNGAS